MSRLFQPGGASYENLELALGVIIISMLFAAAPLVTRNAVLRHRDVQG